MSRPPKDHEELVARHSAGEPFEFLYFWRHEQRGERLGKECLSQWYPSGFAVDGVTYASAEHWMMARKAQLFGDERALESILCAGHPAEVQRLGRTVRVFDFERWRRERLEIVRRGNFEKFRQSEELRAFLLGTGERVLVEASPKDRIWGIGLDEEQAERSTPDRWRGENLLGFALMYVRAQLSESG